MKIVFTGESFRLPALFYCFTVIPIGQKGEPMQVLRKRNVILLASSLFCVLFLFGASSNAIHAQSGDGITDMSNPSVGKNTLQGHIYYPSGHALDRRLRVEITSVQNGSFSTLTSDNGTFSFYRLGTLRTT